MQNIDRDRLEPLTIRREGRYALNAQVTPGLGANLVSFKVDDVELIHWDPEALLTGGDMTGAFNMFPTPCRLQGGAYDFDGRRILQRKRGEDVPIHGLIRDESLDVMDNGDSVTSWIEIAPGHPVYEGFPFICTFTLTHALHDSGLTVSFKLQNKDTRDIPFGYGIHPFWRLHGERKDVSVRIPCDRILELKELVPTGNTESVEGTDLDLRQLRNIETLFVDNVFYPRRPSDTAEVVFSALGRKLTFEASDNFPHMIVYAPEGKPFLCVENLTTTPNAPNLVSNGHGDVATMLVAAPGEAVEGWIKYTIEDV